MKIKEYIIFINMRRCKWVNLNNPKYIKYHDEEWGKLNLDEHYLYKMFILETFQAGLSWECILNKEESFKKAYLNYDIEKIIKFDESKIDELLKFEGIIHNKLKIKASISNSIIYKKIINEFGSFKNYLFLFWDKEIIYEFDKVQNELSDKISLDLKSRGMKFVGSITIYSYLQALGIINSHDENCYLYHNINK